MKNDVEKIKQILADHEKRISELEKGKTLIPNKEEVDTSSVRTLTNLLKETFFNQPKTYGQIIKQLKTNATFNAVTDYHSGLETLVREKRLTRKISHHQWVYFKNG